MEMRDIGPSPADGNAMADTADGSRPPVDDEAVGDVAAETEAVVPRAWSRQWDAAAARFFYTDAATGEATWDEPEGFELRDAGEESASRGKLREDEEDGVWIAQFDPSAGRVYYYHTASGASQWEPPDGLVDGEYQDAKMDGAVTIQSAFRSKKARDRVRQLTGGGSRPTSAASSAGNGRRAARRWRQHFDPRSQQYYYHNIGTGETTWEKPVGEDDVLSETDSRGDSATKIQCAVRKRAASKSVDGKKRLVLDLTSDATINQKLCDIKRAVDEIDRELDARRATMDSSAKWPQLQDALQAWRKSASLIRDRVLEHHHHALLVQQLEATAGERLATAQQFHDAMATTRSECLTLFRSILVSDTQFVEVEVLRVNEAFDRFTRFKGNSVFTISESKVRAVIRVEELEDALSHAEACLRKAMGLTEFSAGAATSRTKVYSEWRDSVQAAVEGVRQLEKMMQYKRDLLELYEQSLIERRESESMRLEEQLSYLYELELRSAEQERLAHARFLDHCRQRWQQGLQRRQDDEAAATKAAEAHQAQKMKDQERMNAMKQDYDHARTRVKLSIWEAVREGVSVDAIRGLIYAEMQKARQNGFDFDVRSARSSRGETLVQIACWAGHTDLTEFLLDEGADLHAVDSITNGYTLLHDSARRGDSSTTRLLVDRGIAQDVVDKSGDTPLHWAVRNNHYDTVHTLLGAYMHRYDPGHNERALRAVRTRNNRGCKPIDLSKSECVRRLLQAFDEGRICSPQSRNRSTSNPSTHGRRMTEINPGQSALRPTNVCADNKGYACLTKASTTPTLSLPNTSDSSEPEHQNQEHEEDEFGIISVNESL